MATSAETFAHIIRHQGVPELVPFLLQLPQKDVVATRQQTLALKHYLNEYYEYETAPGQTEWDRRSSTEEQDEMLFLAGLATYSRKEVLARNRSVIWYNWWNSNVYPTADLAPALAVLAHARPEWLSDWLLRPIGAPSYWLLRELEQTGLLRYDAPTFAAALALFVLPYRHHVPDGSDQAGAIYGHLRQLLGTDATLLTRDLPLLFDYDTGVDSTIIWAGNGCKSTSWLKLLPELAASGHVERGDLLTRCLLALRRDFRRALLLWFKDLFLALAPTPAECLARQAELTELLAHPLPLVVNFAIEQLKDLWAEPGFKAAPLLLNAEALMTRQDLKTGLKTLLAGFGKLLKADQALIPPLRLSAGSPAPIGVLKADQGLAPALAPLATAALANADAAVQERAAKLLADLLGTKKPLLTAAEATATTEALGLYADLLAPAARALLAPWLTATAAAPAAETAAYAPLAEFVPDLSEANTVVPVADWHELLFLTGQVVKPGSEPAAVERWLDGLLRLRGRYPAGYQEQLRPYLFQAAPWLRHVTTDELVAGLLGFNIGHKNGQRSFVVALLISWFSGFELNKVAEVSPNSTTWPQCDPLLHLEKQRLSAAEGRLHPAAAALPLLSTPTHAPHWVAPAVLVQKLLAYEAAAQAPDAADLALALARTAFRAETDAARARQTLPQLQDDGLRALLAWFLAPTAAGPPAPVPAAVLADPSGGRGLTDAPGKFNPFEAPAPLPATLIEVLPWLGAVAARTRHPDTELPELRALADYPGLAAPWQPAWELEQRSELVKQSWNKQLPEYTRTWTELRVAMPHTGQAPPSALLLYSLHARLGRQSFWRLGPDLRFLLTLVPNNPAPLHWHVLRTICHTDDSYGRGEMLVLLRSLLAAGRRYDEPATVLLAVGLTHYAPACRALALEALLAAIAHGRLVPTTLGDALARLLAAGFVPVQRLADALTQTRGLDPRTDDALAQTLEALLPALPTAPPLRNTRLLLDAYARARALAPRQLPAPVQAQLRAWATVASLKPVLKGLLS